MSEKSNSSPVNNSPPHKESKSPAPEESSHNMTGKYATLMETNGEECESWYYFIRYEGNEDNLKFLQEQLESIDWFIEDDMSTFDIDLTHLVSAQTAKEMTKVELNSVSFHRKFDGKLKRIKFKLKKGNSEKVTIVNMGRVFDKLGYGSIDEFVSDEDLDAEDLATDTEETEEDDDEDDDSEEEDDDDEDEDNDKRRVRGLPKALVKKHSQRLVKVGGTRRIQRKRH